MESNSTSILLYQLYQAAIAGSFPVPDGADAVAIARLEAEEALETTRVHMLLAVSDGVAYYIAAASSEMASLPNFATPLATALPNHPLHTGDGVYRSTFGEYAAAIVRRGTRLQLITGFKHEVAASIQPQNEAELVVTEVDDTSAVRLVSEAWIYRSLSDKISRMTALASAGLIGLSLLTVLISSGISGYFGGDPVGSTARVAKEAAALISSARFTQPLGDQMVRLIEVSKGVVETGGWIDSYQYTKDGGEAFTVTLPGWVTAQAIGKLDNNIQTHLQPGGSNLIWARKPNLKGVFAKGLGPAEISDDNNKAGK